MSVEQLVKPVKITVWDYDKAFYGGAPHNREASEIPTKYEVEAWCVGGEEGILAYFYIDDSLCVAHGDDGHWWFVWRCHKQWLPRIQKTVASIEQKDK